MLLFSPRYFFRRATSFAALLFSSRYQADAPGLRDRAGSESVVHDLGLFLLVALAGAGSGAGALRPTHIAEFALCAVKQRLDIFADKMPGAHIARFFLRPHHLGGQ